MQVSFGRQALPSRANSRKSIFPGGVEHEGYFTEDSEVIDFFAPVREDFLSGAPPSYMRAS
jgi:hypothetical protein